MRADEFFKLPDGRSTHIYRMRLADGFGIDVTDWGAAVTSLHTFDRDGNLRDVVLGWKEPSDYYENSIYFGSTVGRIPNRIKDGRFVFDGVTYQFLINDMGSSTLHGGFGYSHRLWELEFASDELLVLTLSSPHGDGGFPGALEIKMSYALCADHSVRMTVNAVADRPCPMDFTNHTYFNLNGAVSDKCRNHFVRIDADKYTETDRFLVPTGKLADVEGTIYDLRKERAFEEIFESRPRGMDDNFILGYENNVWKENAAECRSAESGIKLSVSTDSPGVQFYMGDCLENLNGKAGIYHDGDGFCLETQNWPDAVNNPDFPTVCRSAGESVWQTVWSFGIC